MSTDYTDYHRLRIRIFTDKEKLFPQIKERMSTDYADLHRLRIRIFTDKENDFHRLKKECPQITLITTD